MTNTSITEVTGRQGAFGTFRMFRLTATILVMVICFLTIANSVNAQTYYVPSQQGYYYMGSQNQSFQTNGNRTDYRGVMNGGITVGPIGVQGYNYGNTYTYPQQQTQYRNVPQFYYSNGNSCNSRVYSDYQLPNGAAVYNQWGQPYQQQYYQQRGNVYRRR